MRIFYWVRRVKSDISLESIDLMTSVVRKSDPVVLLSLLQFILRHTTQSLSSVSRRKYWLKIVTVKTINTIKNDQERQERLES